MLRVPDRLLSSAVSTKLAEYQREIDSLAGYAERVAASKTRFSSRNRDDNPVFREVRQTLAEMCRGVRRCMYCEDSLANQVEHFKPKDFYPELAFVWHNYLYACGPCNVRKTNNFPILSDRTGEILFLRRTAGGSIEPPEAGSSALIDPRREDPLDYMQLDLRETYRFQPFDPDPRSLQHQRAQKTIDVLGLNDRDFLPEARGTAYLAYHGIFRLYVDRREQ